MTTTLWCLLVVALLPYGLAGLGGYFRLSQLGRIDNKNPRAQARELTGAGARAVAAQANAWEATAFFAAAVVVTHLAGVPEAALAPWAIAYLVTRLLHPVLYLANLDLVRSLVFVAGLGCIVMMFIKAAGV